MTDDTLQQLLERANPGDKTDLTVAYNAKVTALRAYQDNPGDASRRDLTACRAEYDDTIERLQAKYLGKNAADVAFKNRKQALEWLWDQGMSVSQDKFYRDCKKDHLLRPDKTVSKFDIANYLRRHEGQYSGRPSSADYDERRAVAELEKMEADRDKARHQADELQRQIDRKWMLREDAEQEVCIWTARLRDAVTYHLSRQLLAIIHAAGGDAQRRAEVQSIIDGVLASACNEIAESEEITVLIGDPDEEDAA